MFSIYLLTVRSAYRSVLKSLQGDSPLVSPQFKTWLYVYRNNTVEDDFKSVLIDNYFVEVKEIDRDFSDKGQVDLASAESATDALSTINDDSAEVTTSTFVKPIASGSPNNSKDIVDFETLKKNEPVEQTRKDGQKDSSKFDEVVEDRQYVEAPVIREELLREKNKGKKPAVDASEKKGDSETNSDNATAGKGETSDEEVEAKVIEIVENKPERISISLPLKQFEELEIMHADESRFIGKSVSGGAMMVVWPIFLEISGN